MTIRLDNIAEPTGERRKVLGRGELNWYRWRVWLNEPQDKLDEIQSVEYLLHPTFPQPKWVSADREHEFEIISSGWGQFWIEATVIYKDFHEEHVRYWLDFRKSGKVPTRS